MDIMLQMILIATGILAAYALVSYISTAVIVKTALEPPTRGRRRK